MSRQQNDPQSIRSRMLADHQKTSICVTPGCGNRKHGFGRCQQCMGRKALYGTYTGRELPRFYWANEYAEAAKFVRRFRAHPNIESSRAFLLAWLRNSQAGKHTEGRKAVAWLADKDAPERIAEESLISLIALSWYAKLHAGNPMLTPYMYANAFLKCYKGLPRGPRGQRSPLKPFYVGRPARAAIARELRKLSPLFIEAGEWRDRENALRNAQLKAGSTSFPNLCERCAYNERKAREKRTAELSDPARKKEQRHRWYLTSKNRKKEKRAAYGEAAQERQEAAK